MASAISGLTPALGKLVRRSRRIFGDPILRRWLMRRFAGEEGPVAPFAVGRPPYLEAIPEARTRIGACPFGDLEHGSPSGKLTLRLASGQVVADLRDVGSLFARIHGDVEDLLAFHRFSWVPLAGPEVDRGWVATIWREWIIRHGQVSEGWPWHPYTAAERAINILEFARKFGLPGPRDKTLEALAAHAPAIAHRLEYFGDHATSNHLANDARGLYALGLSLGMEIYAAVGARILLHEARRIFLPSGILREDSSHYHLLLCRQYAHAWILARRFQRPEADALADIVRRAVAVLPQLRLGGGIPLVGDISPDCPPEFLAALVPGSDCSSGWLEWLDQEECLALRNLIDAVGPVDRRSLAADGWLRSDYGDWSALWHGTPGGWSFPAGHGHQDFGACEIHFRETPLFIDPGRGAYGESGDAALYRSARVHNLLTVDDVDPFPENKPYYSDTFRRTITGPAPAFVAAESGAVVTHHGFSRLSGVRAARRAWSFDRNRISVTDEVEGSGSRRITRRLVTPLAVDRQDGAMVLRARNARFRVTADGPIATTPVIAWRAYGRGVPATLLSVESVAELPFRGAIAVDVM